MSEDMLSDIVAYLYIWKIKIDDITKICGCNFDTLKPVDDS